MTQLEHKKYWINSAKRDIPVFENLFSSGHYVWSLFIGHLVLEKLIKAHYVNDNDKVPPKSHDLIGLSEATKLALNQERLIFLGEVNAFQFEARYPDYKDALYKTCTEEYTLKYITKIKEMAEWLMFQLK